MSQQQALAALAPAPSTLLPPAPVLLRVCRRDRDSSRGSTFSKLKNDAKLVCQKQRRV